MRVEFAAAIERAAMADKRIVFLTGDLGFMALENVSKAIGPRFINAGVAEQNMVSVAAGLARKGFIPVVYSITPFLLFRPFEQLRNDVCLHDLPVKLVGNGGGYGYGIMGSSHHALEDLGAMRILPHMTSFVPFAGADVETAVTRMLARPGPSYLRLNSARPAAQDLPPFGPWRKLRDGKRGVVVGVGPALSNVLNILQSAGADGTKTEVADLAVWAVGELPHPELPVELLSDIEHSGRIVTIEEHTAAGGLGESVAAKLLERLSRPVRFLRIAAQGYPSGRYGSQQWHQEESGLGGARLKATLETFMREDRLAQSA